MAQRKDTASKTINASPQVIYQAFIDPKALIVWLPPKGMKTRIDQFEPHEGGSYRMILTYENPEEAHGKSSQNADVVEGKFVELVPGKRIVQLVEFTADDPAFAGTMTMTYQLSPTPDGTEVTIIGENVPAGIKPDDHQKGMASTLANLASYTERTRKGSLNHSHSRSSVLGLFA